MSPLLGCLLWTRSHFFRQVYIIWTFLYLNLIFNCTFFQDWGSREWVISFLVALVWSSFKTLTSDHCFTLKVGIMGSILMTKAVCWVTPSKVMVVRSFEVVAAYVLQVWIRCFFTTEMFSRSPSLMSQVTGQISWERLLLFLL